MSLKLTFNEEHVFLTLGINPDVMIYYPQEDTLPWIGKNFDGNDDAVHFCNYQQLMFDEFQIQKLV